MTDRVLGPTVVDVAGRQTRAIAVAAAVWVVATARAAAGPAVARQGPAPLIGDHTGEEACRYAADWWCDPGRGRLGARPRVLLCLTPTLC